MAFRERAAELEPGDAPGWTALALWAAERDLATQSREAWTQALRADPSSPAANAALGRVEVDGAWVSEEEAWRAHGYVRFEERWVTPAEHEAIVRERAADEAAARERREADLRVREAEARAREAEARAREAEAATEGSADEGIPLWWGWGGGIGLPVEPEPPEPPPVPPPPTPPSNWQSVPWTHPAPGREPQKPD